MNKRNIIREEINEAQHKWADNVIELGKLIKTPAALVQKAEEFLDNLYSFREGQVLFKPTRASAHPFRLTRESALSYFIGGNSTFSEDTGFVLRPWKSVQFDNAGIYCNGATAMAMGHYTFTSMEEETLLAEYSFGYVQDEDGLLRIVLHHSSIPFHS